MVANLGILGQDSLGSGVSFTVAHALDPTVLSVMYNELVKMMQHNASSRNPLSTIITFAGIAIVSHVASLLPHFDSNCWIIDIGATDHMTSNLALFTSLQMLKNTIHVGLPDGTIKLVKHARSASLIPHLTIHHVPYIPTFKTQPLICW